MAGKTKKSDARATFEKLEKDFQDLKDENIQLKAENANLNKLFYARGKDPWVTVSEVKNGDVTETTKVLNFGTKGMIVRVVESNVAVFVPHAKYTEVKKADSSVEYKFR